MKNYHESSLNVSMTARRFSIGEKVILLEHYLHIKKGSIGEIILVLGDGSYRVNFDGKKYLTLGAHQLQKIIYIRRKENNDTN